LEPGVDLTSVGADTVRQITRHLLATNPRPGRQTVGQIG